MWRSRRVWGPTDPAFAEGVERRILEVVQSLQELVHGYDFARLLTLYYRAHLEGDDEAKARVVKWFRGEYRTKAEAREELGVNIVITDDDWYDYLKLFAVVPQGGRLRRPARAHRRAGEPVQDPQQRGAPVQLREDPDDVQRHAAGHAPATWAS